MKIKYIIQQLVIISFLVSCNNSQSLENYPLEIIESELENKYDIAKWILYELHTNYNKVGFYTGDSRLYDKKATNGIPFVAYNLEFSEKSIKNDTTQISFFFVNEENHRIVPRYDKRNFHTVVFVKDNIFRIGADDVYYIRYEDLKNNYKPSDFEEVLKENSSELNPWLRKKAKEKGIL